MKKTRKALSLLLALVMVLSLLPVGQGVAAADELRGTAYAVYSESDKTLTFFRSENTYTEGEGQTVTDLAGNQYIGTVYTGVETARYARWSIPPWQWESDSMTKVVFVDTIRPISTAYWFYHCFSLVEIEGLEKLDTSQVTDMESMFQTCGYLTSLNVSNWDTSKVTNMYHVFCECYSLTSLDVHSWDTSNVMDMTSMFSDCASLTSLDLSGWDTSHVTSMECMFADCTSLTSVDVSSFDTSHVTNMHCMFGGFFGGCASLTSLDVSGFDTSNVTDMCFMFQSCGSLTSLDVSDWDTTSVKDMFGMFHGCRSLTSLDVSDWNVTRATSMEYMFYGCYGLTNLDVSDWDTSSVYDVHDMFRGCSGLKSLDLSGWETASVKNIRNMFWGCSGLKSINLSGWNTDKVWDMRNMFYNCNGLTELTLPARFIPSGIDSDYRPWLPDQLNMVKVGDSADALPVGAGDVDHRYILASPEKKTFLRSGNTDVAANRWNAGADWGNELLQTNAHVIFFQGSSDGTVRPKDNITKGETAMLFYRLLQDKNVQITESFEDLSADAWYTNAVLTLASLNIVYGNGDSTFGPEKPITRREFITMCARFSDQKPGVCPFPDVSEDDWAYDAIGTAASYGWVTGDENGNFHPDDNITRAEVAVILNRMLGRAPDKAYIDAHESELVSFIDLKKGAWYYYDMVEATTPHSYTMEGGKEIWTFIDN